MTVDHPVGTEIFVDERFVIPPQKPGFTVVEMPHAIARATDDNGQDVTDVLNKLNAAFVATYKIPAIAARIRDAGGVEMPISPDAYTAVIRADLERWGPVIRKLGIKAD